MGHKTYEVFHSPVISLYKLGNFHPCNSALYQQHLLKQLLRISSHQGIHLVHLVPGRVPHAVPLLLHLLPVALYPLVQEEVDEVCQVEDSHAEQQPHVSCIVYC